MVFICNTCNIDFGKSPCFFKHGSPKYCSRECYNQKRKKPIRNCKKCGTICNSSRTEYCSNKCSPKMPRKTERLCLDCKITIPTRSIEGKRKPARCQKCNSISNRKYNKKIKETTGLSYDATVFNSNPNTIFRKSVTRARVNSRKNKLKDAKFDITFEFIKDLFHKQEGKCAISGLKIDVQHGKGRNPFGLSLDRKDSDVGYTQENTQIVCYAANLMKSDLNEIQFKTFIKAIYERLQIEN